MMVITMALVLLWELFFRKNWVEWIRTYVRSRSTGYFVQIKSVYYFQKKKYQPVLIK